MLVSAGALATGAVAGTGPELELHGELGVQRAYASGSFEPALARLDAGLSGQIRTERCSARIGLRWRADDYLAPDRQHSGELREAAAECRQGAWLLKVGRQVVVWGKADNFRVLDAVHPFDYREFLLESKEEAPAAHDGQSGTQGGRERRRAVAAHCRAPQRYPARTARPVRRAVSPRRTRSGGSAFAGLGPARARPGSGSIRASSSGTPSICWSAGRRRTGMAWHRKRQAWSGNPIASGSPVAASIWPWAPGCCGARRCAPRASGCPLPCRVA
ncbi:hypothetical protein LP420_39405 [Massilia sp. B-10]|nr:hypothetical protein LP420_39405 [Massilia sp. B-10]